MASRCTGGKDTVRVRAWMTSQRMLLVAWIPAERGGYNIVGNAQQ